MNHFNIKKINGKFNVSIFWGHWKQQGRICEKLKKHWNLKHGVSSYDVDESWTSQINYKYKEDTSTGQIFQFCQPIQLKKTIGSKTTDENKEKWSKKNGDLKTIRVWHLLKCDCDDIDCHKFIDRDKNGSLNILKIGLDILNYSFRFFPRYVPNNNTLLVDSVSETTGSSL